MSDIPVGRITQLNNVPASPTRSHVARTMVPHSVMQSQIDAAYTAVAAERERCARIADEEEGFVTASAGASRRRWMLWTSGFHARSEPATRSSSSGPRSSYERGKQCL